MVLNNFNSRINEENKNLYYVLIFSYIYFGTNTLIQSSVIGMYPSFIITFLVSIVLLFKEYIFKNKEIEINKSYFFIIVILTMIIAGSMIFNLDNSNGNFLLVIKIIQSAIVTLCIPFDTFKKVYTNIMTFLGIYSLISLVMAVNFSFQGIFPHIVNPTGLSFHNFGFSFVLDFPGHYGMRNYGVFTEPGMYVCFLIPALIFEMFSDKERPRFWVALILILTLISSFSPVGLLASLILSVIYIFRKSHIKIRGKYTLAIIITVAVISLLNSSTYSSVIDMTLNKVEDENLVESSRFASISANLQEGLTNPFFGKGITEITQVAERLGSNTSTTTAFFLAYGIFFAFLINIALYFLFKSNSLNHISNFIVLLVFLFAVNSQALIHSDIYWLLTMYGISLLFRKSP